MLIYKITNLLDGKIYIGQTIQTMASRWRDHVRGDKQKESYLHRAIQKHGVENFSIEEIEYSKTLEGLNVLEEFYIKKYNCMAPLGYNLLPGGLNRRLHEDTKKKLSDLNKGKIIPNRWDKGFLGEHTEETKDKISEALKGRPITNRYTGGNKAPRTDAQKAHLSSVLKGKPNVALYKAIVCVETGDEFESVNEVAAMFELNRATVSQLIKSGKPHYVRRISFKHKAA